MLINRASSRIVDDIGKIFSDAVSAKLDELQTNAFAIEKAGGLPVDAVRSVIRDDGKRAIPRLTRAKEICDLLDLELYVGPRRSHAEVPTTAADAESDFALIETTGVEVSAGPGRSVDAIGSGAPLAFRKEWLSKVGVAADSARLLRARGDSMEPLIWDGDTLMIDISRTMPRLRPDARKVPNSRFSDEVFVVEIEGDLRVKTLRRPAEDRIVLYSENSRRYEPEIFVGSELSQLNIIGKVVWWGHVAS